MLKKKSIISAVVLGTLCCTSCGGSAIPGSDSALTAFVAENKKNLKTYETDGKTILTEQYVSEMDKDYSVLENLRDSSEAVVKGTVVSEDGTFVAQGGAPWTFYSIEVEEVLQGNVLDTVITVGEQQGYSSLKDELEQYPKEVAERLLEEYGEYTEEELDDIYLFESNGSPLLEEGDTVVVALNNRNLEGLEGDFWAVAAEAYGKFYETDSENYQRIFDAGQNAAYTNDNESDIVPELSETYSYEELEAVFQ